MSDVIKCIHLVKRCHTFYGDARDARGPGADPGFKKGGFHVVPKSDTGGATHNYL